MNLDAQQELRFYDFQDVISELEVEDLEASTWSLINDWMTAWMNYVRYGATPPGSDRPPSKPPHP